MVVGVECTLRLLVVGRALADASGPITAIAAKRSVGARPPPAGCLPLCRPRRRHCAEAYASLGELAHLRLPSVPHQA